MDKNDDGVSHPEYTSVLSQTFAVFEFYTSVSERILIIVQRYPTIKLQVLSKELKLILQWIVINFASNYRFIPAFLMAYMCMCV